MDADLVLVADILRPRGNRGEVLARSQSDVPGRLETLRNANAHLLTGEDVGVEIEASWRHKDLWVLKFSGVDSISAAERFRGAEIQIAKTDRGKLPHGEYFQSELVGCAVIEKASGKSLGVVEGWQQYGGPPLMEVKVGGREVLIPFVAPICQEVDLGQRTIKVDLPKGLLEL